MKKQSSSFILTFSLVVSLFFIACNNDRVSRAKVEGVFNNLSTCLKGCDATLERYNRAVAFCIAHYSIIDPYAKRLADCNHNTTCEDTILTEIRKRCEEENKGLWDEWEKCRQDCLNKFPEAIGINNR
jgi:hypothetical protein